MKKIALSIIIMLFSVFLPAKIFAITVRQDTSIPIKYFYDIAFSLQQKAKNNANLTTYKISPTEVLFLPFEMYETVDCDMNKSMAFIEFARAKETEKQLQMTQQVATPVIFQVPKQEAIEVVRPAQKMGIAEIMFIIEEVGRGAMY